MISLAGSDRILREQQSRFDTSTVLRDWTWGDLANLVDRQMRLMGTSRSDGSSTRPAPQSRVN